MRSFVSTSLRIVLLIVWHAHIATASDSSELAAALDRLLDNHSTAQRTTVALKVVDLATGDVLYDRFGDRLLTPASNLKIYTSACALDLFGPEHCFPTRVTARVDRASHTIVGDLQLTGGGNAMLSMADLRQLANQVVDEWKVTTLRGEVVVDNSRYSDVQLGPGWMWDDQPYYFNMRVTPLMVDFNVRTLPGKFDDDGDPVRRAVENPASWVAEEFRQMLIAGGVTIETGDHDGAAGQQLTIRYEGVPLSATLKHFNRVSENAVGEVLLHEIAIAHGKTRPSWSDGAEQIAAWLHDKAGLQRGSFRLVDGSGLSRYNLISADSSVRLLAYMHQHEHFKTFVETLPAYEVESSPDGAQALVRAKPGGMSGVSTISGFLQTPGSSELAFSLLANGFVGTNKPVRDLRERVWEELARYQK